MADPANPAKSSSSLLPEHQPSLCGGIASSHLAGPGYLTQDLNPGGAWENCTSGPFSAQALGGDPDTV